MPSSRRALPSLADATPASRPLARLSSPRVATLLAQALTRADGSTGAHCIHELSMRGAMGAQVEGWLDRLWAVAAESIPDWLPMRYVEWLPAAYAITARFEATTAGCTGVYLILLDYSDSPRGPHGVYVGISTHAPAERFEQHKLGIRASGPVLRRGLEPLAGLTLHLRRLSRAEAAVIEEHLAEALRAAGLIVKGGH